MSYFMEHQAGGGALNFIERGYIAGDYAGNWVPNPAGFNFNYAISGNVMAITFNCSGGAYAGPGYQWFIKIPNLIQPANLSAGTLNQGLNACVLIPDAGPGYVIGLVSPLDAVFSGDPFGDGSGVLQITQNNAPLPVASVFIYGSCIFQTV